jgi:hypothetical protein
MYLVLLGPCYYNNLLYSTLVHVSNDGLFNLSGNQ